MVYRFGSVTRVTRQVSLVGFAGFNFYNVFVVFYKSLLVHFLLPITLFILRFTASDYPFGIFFFLFFISGAMWLSIRMKHFFDNLQKVCSKSKEGKNQIIYNSLGARKQNKLNRRAKISYGYLCRVKMNLSFNDKALFKNCK